MDAVLRQVLDGGRASTASPVLAQSLQEARRSAWGGGEAHRKRKTPLNFHSPGPGLGQTQLCNPCSVEFLCEQPHCVSVLSVEASLFQRGEQPGQRKVIMLDGSGPATCSGSEHQEAREGSGTFFVTKAASGWTLVGVARGKLRKCYQSHSLDQH